MLKLCTILGIIIMACAFYMRGIIKGVTSDNLIILFEIKISPTLRTQIVGTITAIRYQ
jgi:hypothetical protein